MVVNTAFYSLREKKINQIFFETNFVSQWLPEFEWNRFKFLADFFQEVVNGAIYVSGGTFRGQSIYFQKSKELFLPELGQKTFSFSYQKVPWTTLKTDVFSSIPKLSMNGFSLENNSFRRFLGILAGKLRQGCQNDSLRRQKSHWRKWFFNSNHLILDIVISHWTQTFGLWLKFLNRDINTAFSASSWTASGEKSF